MLIGVGEDDGENGNALLLNGAARPGDGSRQSTDVMLRAMESDALLLEIEPRRRRPRVAPAHVMKHVGVGERL